MPNQQYATIISNVGAGKIAATIASGTLLFITEAAVGDGNGAFYTPTPSQTELRREVWRGDIAASEIDPAEANMINVRFVVPSEAGGFTVREAALFDGAGDLLAVCNLPDTKKEIYGSGTVGKLTIVMRIVVTDTDALVFEISPLLDGVSIEQLTASVAAHNRDYTAHDDLQTRITDLDGRMDSLEVDARPGETVSIIPPNGMVAQDVQSAVDELFQFASDGKTAIAGSIGDPATEADTFPTLSGIVDTAKTSLAVGLTAKGVPSSGSEPLQQLADKVLTLKIDPLETVEYTILASGIFTVPADCYTYDVCLIGGGTGSVNPTYGQVNGCGGKMNTVTHVSCTPEQTIIATIGAGGPGFSATGAGGDSIFGEYVGLGGVRVTPVPAALQMWGSANGLYVCGAGNVTMAGGGVQISTSWGYSGAKGEDGKGGGGSWGYRTDNGRADGYSGGSGRIAVRCYISK